MKTVHSASTLRQDDAKLNRVKTSCAHSAQGGRVLFRDSAEIVSAKIPEGFHGTMSVCVEFTNILACNTNCVLYM